ncbi:MAG: hypothetical protein KJ614_05820 [Gammaproteobacteria bacterium]|uniref:DUF6776 family protein n=1 Tax=Rhodoferax sp. TaxID=50421 RepID=UPI0017C9DB88|nr:DUF6776 family protein [Rhodoferax sp.]MBU3898435.1 hypothetical protein [Gammaproteobacteria bacterium]MBA3056777.1 hypothetical protein [Rhodoferax sp.]MBU3998154.1 hypothetical protein [Gammaproteobacteria bacterium]MBU4079209.1 hypothetical protein [Gammaproteobacteria bacterium]MBU4115354.1 hypothetical protein [Gammaproteobacteria bacterium]
MRLRLLIRRLTVSAPRMAVRSAMPWPLRWLALAIVLGFCAALALWAFEFGKDIAGLERGTKAQLQQVRTELAALQLELATVKSARDQAQSVANTVDTLLTTEKVAQESLLAQNKQLEAENRSLRDDLGFFETLIPAQVGGAIAIRGLQGELRNEREIRWQVLVIQANKNAPEFNGRLELSFSGLLNGKPWLATLPGGAQVLKLKQYGRMEGVFELPAQVVVKGLSAKVLEGSLVRSAQSIKL